MTFNKDLPLNIEETNKWDLFDFKICVNEFADIIEKLNQNYPKIQFIIFTAKYNKNLVGILISEDKSQKVESMTTIIPTSLLYLIYVNPFFRNKGIGKKLLGEYLKKQKSRDIASIYMNVPQKYKMGINFLLKNDFHQLHRNKNSLIFKYNLCNDYEIRDSVLIGEHFNLFLD